MKKPKKHHVIYENMENKISSAVIEILSFRQKNLTSLYYRIKQHFTKKKKNNSVKEEKLDC